jgi:hypothetical protein
MKNENLIKSFTLLESIDNFSKGDVLVLKKFQGLIGLSIDELCFENPSNGKILKYKWIIDNIDKIKIKEYFLNKDEKFDYISW